jgi:UDP-N-acetylmuramyl pentapeptide phosphotransferase/UDP-N-acetylglucosamine-1-phosphate transferase
VIELFSSALDLVQIAHDTQFFHEEPAPGGGGGGGASVIVIVAGIVVSLVAVAGLIWLKRRVDG